jgi:hypothetical protein
MKRKKMVTLRIIYIIFIIISFLFITCKPSYIDDVKIESQYSYISDKAALFGIIGNIAEIPPENLDFLFLTLITKNLNENLFDKEEEIGKWLKKKYGSKLKNGEAIEFSYKYNNETNGLDIIYKPFNNSIFPINIISYYDYVSTLDGSIYEKYPSNQRLSNTKWQNIDDGNNLIFIENNFTFPNITLRDHTFIGPYRIINNIVILDFSAGKTFRDGDTLAFGEREIRGTLNGFILTLPNFGKFVRVE